MLRVFHFCFCRSFVLVCLFHNNKWLKIDPHMVLFLHIVKLVSLLCWRNYYNKLLGVAFFVRHFCFLPFLELNFIVRRINNGAGGVAPQPEHSQTVAQHSDRIVVPQFFPIQILGPIPGDQSADRSHLERIIARRI